MREFFREIVLAEIDTPVVVFFDRLEAIRDEPLAQDLLKFVRACYDARATVPEFNRILAALASADPDGQVLDLKLNYTGEWYSYGV